MPKQGEIDYIKNIGPESAAHAANKPFAADNASHYLANMAAIMGMLPKRPARVLDLGCGTGWTSGFFARHGHDVTGVDLCPDMIDLACEHNRELDNVRFLVSDYEELSFRDEFDAAVFYDSLHHAVDEEAALRAAYRALKPGAILITSEPGEGHEEAPETRNAVERFGVTEKDMPPNHIIEVATKIGFRSSRIFPHAFDVQVHLYGPPDNPRPAAAAAVMRPRRKWFSLSGFLTSQLLRLLGVKAGIFPSRLAAFNYIRYAYLPLLNGAPQRGGITVLRK